MTMMRNLTLSELSRLPALLKKYRGSHQVAHDSDKIPKLETVKRDKSALAISHSFKLILKPAIH
jgi:hypothetical protein